ncbi:mitochondrial carrier protein LEU5 [Morchella snyderi]|nr:mitochondrial carrier protein LEU5 [Morchella snyderi]
MPEAVSFRNSHGEATAAVHHDPITPVPKPTPTLLVPTHDKRSLDYILRSGAAGGFAGCAAKTLIAPLDRVKILFQASSPAYAKYSTSWLGAISAMQDITHREGTFGLFRGHSATLLRIFPYAAIKFVAYEQIRSVLIPTKEQETTLRRLLSGSAAGVTSVFFTYPLEVIRVRLAFETRTTARTGLWGICHRLYREPTAASAVAGGGLTNFYRGFSPTLLGMLPYAGISFLTHDVTGDWLRRGPLAQWSTVAKTDEGGRHGGRRPTLKAWAELVSGGVAGMVAQTASYPLEVVRRRMQVSGAVGEGVGVGIGETARRIWSAGGFRGFFVGLGIGYVKVGPMVATSFYVYERCKLYLGIN